MKRIYWTDKYFIGVVKFFDTNNDFGFIASNNCNMPASEYNQDFYVNSASFIEDDAKRDGQIVVFQVKKLYNGKKQALNVRCITNSGMDSQLALSYYGDHEYIEGKNHRRINLYRQTFKPIRMVADKVKHIIEEDVERSPKKTSEHFKFFVDHYKQNMHSKDRYIFDRNFSTNDKSIWQSLLSIFTEEERGAILEIYPTIIRYFDETNFVQKWLVRKLSDDSTLSDWQDVARIFEYIPKECEIFAKQRIEMLVDDKIDKVFEELSSPHSDISENDLKFLKKDCMKRDVGIYVNSNNKNAVNKLYSYLRLTSKQYEEKIEKCLDSVKRNRFKKEIETFVGSQYNDDKRRDFFFYLNSLSEKDFLTFRDDLKLSVSQVFDNAIKEKKYGFVVGDIKQLSILGEDYLTLYRQKLLPLIKETLKESLRTNLNSIYRMKFNFFTSFEDYCSIYEETEKAEIRQVLIPILKETQSIYVLSEMSTGSHTWLSIDEALILSKQIISQWSYTDIKRFVEGKPELFEHSVVFADIVIERFKEVTEKIPLNRFFDGTQSEKRENESDFRCPEMENCIFLNELKKLIPSFQRSSQWEGYINSRTICDLLILYEYNVILSLPVEIVEIIINTISLDDVYADKRQWYCKPSLKSAIYTKVLATTWIDLFTLIARRLESMEMKDENVALAVLLTELMTANRPNSDSDYYIRRDWEKCFTDQIQDFKRAKKINPRLSVILWAVHSKTTTSSAYLTEVFAVLPPYLQIKIVKKLFKSMSEGKIHYTAESLYNLVSNGNKSICFPLEIAFVYLKLREKDQSRTLNNNVMLQLLEGREDTDEWIGIRSIMTQCSGRWIANVFVDGRDYISKWRHNGYFNGIISKVQEDRLRVFIPQKMVDEYGNIQKYNNKYFTRVIQYIHMTYKENEYQTVNEQNGVSYYFDKLYEVELFAIARSFNFKYNGFDEFCEFEIDEDNQDEFCECRLSNKVADNQNIAFYWCGNKPCFRPPVRYCTDDEWEHYTILDFMRILGISPDYINMNGKRTKFGHYIILSSYLKNFAKFYEHLKCRECGKLIKPLDITNFASRAITEFSCTNDSCSNRDTIIYINHCFNKQKCKTIIDSRDSKQCPNGLYICPQCGACCSTANFSLRINHLHMVGGIISERLKRFVENNLGHWEKHYFFCYKCGKAMHLRNDGHYVCLDCKTEYEYSGESV